MANIEGHIDLPLEKIEKCSVCGSKKDLRLCASCAEKVYCSKDCQTVDWKTGGHKTACKKFGRLDLAVVYPFFSGVSQICRIHSDVPPHPAMLHSITNDPLPGNPAAIRPVFVAPRVLREVKVVALSPTTLPFTKVASTEWWPKGPTAKIRHKLFRRIMNERYVLATCVVVCLAILSEVYADPDVRLRYRSSPIADFGIVCGSVRVTAEDRLGYLLSDGTFIPGNDPEDHFWIYFKTARGEEVYLDNNMFGFNLAHVATTDAFFDEPPGNLMGMVPAFFSDRELNRHIAAINLLHREQRRFSVLRDVNLHKAVLRRNIDYNAILAFTKKVAKRELNSDEKNLIPKWVGVALYTVGVAMSEGKWKQWPTTPPSFMADTDPGQMDGFK